MDLMINYRYFVWTPKTDTLYRIYVLTNEKYLYNVDSIHKDHETFIEHPGIILLAELGNIVEVQKETLKCRTSVEFCRTTSNYLKYEDGKFYRFKYYSGANLTKIEVVKYGI